MLPSHYNEVLVLFSYLVAILASYTALDMAGRVGSAEKNAARWWLAGGSFAMGLGVWAMHFIGMLAFNLPIALSYDPLITVLSLVIAIASSAFALRLMALGELNQRTLGVGALILGGGIVLMHYTGMGALLIEPAIHYDARWVALSIIIALVASSCALSMSFRLRHQLAWVRSLRLLAALVMGLAIIGMHYTGMYAANFTMGMHASHAGVNANWLAVVVIVVTLAVLAIALIVSVLDSRLQARTSLLAHSLARANNELTHLALHDNLTKLPNRVLLEQRLASELDLARSAGGGFAVMFMDLDGFKAINDAYGHDTGDRLLIAVTDRFSRLLHADDMLARIGGDEFVLLTRSEDRPEIARMADRLVQSMSQPFMLTRYPLSVSLSVGIACYPGDGNDQRELLLNADAAMYHTKHLGRNGHSFFLAAMNINAQQQLQLINDLRQARTRDELRLHYQPKFTAPSGPVTGFEALLRWQHPERGLLAPDMFLPLAEKTGLIITIGEWVLDEACRQLSLWRQQGQLEWCVAVNLSALQFEQPNLVEKVMAIIARHGVPPEKLILEVTETVAMRDLDASILILERLRQLGVKSSIDDFGSGYSSLLYLKRLPASELKIDRGFINDLHADNKDATIVAAIIALGQSLQLNVVAEGVETTEQQQFLTDMGCNSLQGYLLGRPLPPEQIDAQIHSELKDC